MKANELRIGNWVMGNAPFQVNANDIAMHDYQFKLNGEQRYNPIALTEEILLKCGFIEYTSSDDLRIDIDESNLMSYNFEDESVDIGDELTVKCKYLHQLQNLYFALTNEELEIVL